jgi:16S rRNA pseudouridine516 synthase
VASGVARCAPVPRLDALIAKALGLSRKRGTALVRARAVTDEEGVPLSDPALRLPPSALPRIVQVKGAKVTLRTRFDLLLHKPVGCVTALSDERHPTAYAFLSEAPMHRELRAVGRLDLDTSGLLLWTTDGDTLHRLTHPRYQIARVYHVGLSRPFAAPTEDLELEDGHRPRIASLATLAESDLHPALRRSPESVVHARITLTSGRFHEVRRIFAALGSEVVDLCRVAFGPLELPPDLAPGAWLEADLAAIVHGRHPAPP